MTENIYYSSVNTDLGTLMLASTDKGICQIRFTQGDSAGFFAWLEKKIGTRWKVSERVHRETTKELLEYFDGRRKQFDSPLDLRGTTFQLKIWSLLREIPYGETVSYGEIAKKAGIPKGARAIGMASHVNPVLLMVPCHRVIGKNGSLVGFGCGVDLKQKLLDLERR